MEVTVPKRSSFRWAHNVPDSGNADPSWRHATRPRHRLAVAQRSNAPVSCNEDQNVRVT